MNNQFIPRESSILSVHPLMWVSSVILYSVSCLLYSVFMPNKPKVKRAKINLSSLITSKYENNGHLVIRKTNPIQTQFKANQSQFWADIKGGKAKQTQSKHVLSEVEWANLITFSYFFMDRPNQKAKMLKA